MRGWLSGPLDLEENYEFGRRTPRSGNLNKGLMEGSWFLNDCNPDACGVSRRERRDLHDRQFGFAETLARSGIGANRVHLQSVPGRGCPGNLVRRCAGLSWSTT